MSGRSPISSRCSSSVTRGVALACPRLPLRAGNHSLHYPPTSTPRRQPLSPARAEEQQAWVYLLSSSSRLATDLATPASPLRPGTWASSRPSSSGTTLQLFGQVWRTSGVLRKSYGEGNHEGERGIRRRRGGMERGMRGGTDGTKQMASHFRYGEGGEIEKWRTGGEGGDHHQHDNRPCNPPKCISSMAARRGRGRWGRNPPPDIHAGTHRHVPPERIRRRPARPRVSSLCERAATGHGLRRQE